MSNEPPTSILIIGSGVFGLSTAYELTQTSIFNSSTITLVDRLPFPPPDGASIDSSRIVRSDYADPAYAQLGALAQQRWRADWGANERYHETGLILVSNEGEGNEAYVKKSLANVQNMVKATKSEEISGQLSDIDVLSTPDAIAKASGGNKGALGPCGTFGYLNRRSGWADAEAAMVWLREKVASTNRVSFVTQAVQKLLFSEDGISVQGVLLADKMSLKADFTILAAGSWTPSLVDLRGLVQCTAQTLSYIPISSSEAIIFDKVPVQLNLSNGLFIIPPPAPNNHLMDVPKQMYVKLARHCNGYLNPTSIPHPEPHNAADNSSTITVSVPCKSPLDTFPSSASEPLRSFAQHILPANLADRPFSKTRLCHYADTPTGDFLVDWHPKYGKTLFIATGGSGHGFKFLPVIGEAIVRCLLDGKQPDDEKWIIDKDTMKSLSDKWAWRKPLSSDGPWPTADGSRSGPVGLILADEVNKDKAT